MNKERHDKLKNCREKTFKETIYILVIITILFLMAKFVETITSMTEIYYLLMLIIAKVKIAVRN